MSRPIGIFGRGRLAREVAATASDRVAWLCGRGEQPGEPVAVAIDCSLGEAVESHLEWALEHTTDLVIAVTGWSLDGLEERVARRIGVVVAPNGSLTVVLMTRFARVLGGFVHARYGGEAGGYLLDHHHAAKRDAPSGTALRLAAAWREGSASTRLPGAGAAGADIANAGIASVDVDATDTAAELAISTLRAGHAAGTHVLGFDAPGEQLEIVHRARSRAPFAQGLLCAADWVAGRRGLFTMDQVAEEVVGPLFVRSRE
jgi:4-hydroxy-tetrahydrodipicolinate reductase